jgi:hypothetical protein
MARLGQLIFEIDRAATLTVRTVTDGMEDGISLPRFLPAKPEAHRISCDRLSYIFLANIL